jgi:hypothetical protein
LVIGHAYAARKAAASSRRGISARRSPTFDPSHGGEFPILASAPVADLIPVALLGAGCRHGAGVLRRGGAGACHARPGAVDAGGRAAASVVPDGSLELVVRADLARRSKLP